MDPDSLQILAVLDWELAAPGPGLVDLASLLQAFPVDYRGEIISPGLPAHGEAISYESEELQPGGPGGGNGGLQFPRLKQLITEYKQMYQSFSSRFTGKKNSRL